MFLNTRHLENREEDHLTEFFAALLLSSPSFLKDFQKLVLSRFIKKQHEQNHKDGWNNPNAEAVFVVDDGTVAMTNILR